MMVRPALDRDRIGRVVAAWAAVFAILALAFVINYTVLPRLDHRYRAEFYPGDALGAALTQRFHAATGSAAALRHRLDVGRRQSRALFAGPAAGADRRRAGRAPWIDLDDLRKDGAVVVWTQGDPKVLPAPFAAVAPDAEVGAPFDLPMRRGDGAVHVGWAILKPQ